MTMKIEGLEQATLVKQLGSSRPGGTEEVRPPQQETDSTRQNGGETVHLSERAKLMALAKAELEKIPEVDQKKVDDIRDRIKQGTYEADSRKIADRIMQEAVFGVIA